MVEKTITISIDANVQKFKKALADARASVTKTGQEIKRETEKVSKDFGRIGQDLDTSGISDVSEKAKAAIEDMKDSASEIGENLSESGSRGKEALDDLGKSAKRIGEEVKVDAEKMSKSVESVGKSGKFKAFAESFKGISPAFDGLVDKVSEVGDKMKGMGKLGKLAIGGIVTAVVGLAVVMTKKLAEAMLQVTGKFAKLSDPVRFDKATSKMQESLRKLKTSIGELASPVFEWMSKGVEALANGLTWVIEKIAQLVGFLQGLLGLGHKVNQTLNGTSDAMEEAGASADAGLASFDKLNTLNTGEMGDMKQAKKMAQLMEKARKSGKDIAKNFKEALKPLNDLLTMDVSKLWKRFKDAAGNAWDSIKQWSSDTWSSVERTASDTWNRISGWVSDTWSGFRSMGEQAWTTIKDTASSVWETLKDVSSRYWETIGNVGRTIWAALVDFISVRVSGVADLLKKVMTGVVDVFRAAWDKAFGAIKGAIDWVLDKIHWVTDKIGGLRDAVGGIGEKVSGAVSGFVGGVTDKVKGVLGFARGGLFEPNSPQLVMVGDNKTEPEVIAPRSMIMDAMRQVISEAGGFGKSQPIEVSLNIDGREFARATYDDLESERQRRGTVY